MKRWVVNVDVIPAGRSWTESIEMEFEVEATKATTAVKRAIDQLNISDKDLIHTIHVSRPM